MKLKELPVSLYKEMVLSWVSPRKIVSPEAKVLPVIVSLTTIESRLSIVHLAVRSILTQKSIPSKVVLWLNVSLEEKIPHSLRELETSGRFECRFTVEDCPHVKLIPSLLEFPDATVVTCDDDAMYRSGWLERIYATSLKYPGAVVSNRLRTIVYDKNKELLPYRKWIYTPSQKWQFQLPIGAEGVLYPSGCFAKEVTDFHLALKLAPKADDLWFKALSLVNETPCVLTENPVKESIPIRNSQKISLKKTNIRQDRNRLQWLDLTAYFQLDKLLK